MTECRYYETIDSACGENRYYITPFETLRVGAGVCKYFIGCFIWACIISSPTTHAAISPLLYFLSLYSLSHFIYYPESYFFLLRLMSLIEVWFLNSAIEYPLSPISGIANSERTFPASDLTHNKSVHFYLARYYSRTCRLHARSAINFGVQSAVKG